MGGYLVRDNSFMYNGKGISSNITNNINVENNSFYLNGSTINGKFAGLLINCGTGHNLLNNAVQVAPDDFAFKVSTGTGFLANANYYVGGDNAGNIPAGDQLVSQIFTDPDNLDFSLVRGIPSGTGASLATWNSLKAKLDEHGVTIQFTTGRLITRGRQSGSHKIHRKAPPSITHIIMILTIRKSW